MSPAISCVRLPPELCRCCCFMPHNDNRVVAAHFAPVTRWINRFRMYNVSFYRKHLLIPTSWMGTHIELYVQGALSASQWWLNGIPIAGGTVFNSGYTALILRLDNNPGILWGNAINVITAFVDGTQKTGCVNARTHSCFCASGSALMSRRSRLAKQLCVHRASYTPQVVVRRSRATSARLPNVIYTVWRYCNAWHRRAR